VKKPHLSNRLMELGILGLGNVFKEYQKGAVTMARIQGAIYYLKAVQSVRSGFMTLFFVLFGLLFFFAGIVLLHFAAYFFLAEGPGHRAWALLGLGFAESAVSAGFVGWLLSSKRWVDFAMHWNPGIRKLLQTARSRGANDLGLDMED
jgi:hypothetical protein